MVRPIRLAGSDHLHRWVWAALYAGSQLQCGHLDRVSDCCWSGTGGIRANSLYRCSSRLEQEGHVVRKYAKQFRFFLFFCLLSFLLCFS